MTDGNDLAALADRVAREGPSAAERSVARMYEEDPFWWERFGERGRRFADEDGQYHVTYLVEALRQGSPLTLVEYARWLRGVLTARGMCTLHLVENLGRLATVLVGRDATMGPAAGFLRAAVAGLEYTDGPAGGLQGAADEVAEAVASELAGTEGGSDDAAWREARHLVSYVADALASGRGDLLAAHVRWLAGALRERPEGPDPARLFDAVERALSALPEGVQGATSSFRAARREAGA